MGWFNHQLVNRLKCFCSPSKQISPFARNGSETCTSWKSYRLVPSREISLCTMLWRMDVKRLGWGDVMMACFSQTAESTKKNLRVNNRTPKMIQYVDICWYSLCRLTFLMFLFPKNQGPGCCLKKKLPEPFRYVCLWWILLDQTCFFREI